MGRIEKDVKRIVRNDHFIKAFEYVAKTKELNQAQLAEAIGSMTSTISKYKNGLRPVSEDTMDALIRVSATIDGGDGQIYKPYLLGDSDYMLLRNVPDNEIIEVNRRRDNPDYDVMKKNENPHPIDQSSLVNAALAAKDGTIAELRERILDLQGRIKDKDELIASLRQQLANITVHKPAIYSTDNGHPLPIAAESTNL